MGDAIQRPTDRNLRGGMPRDPLEYFFDFSQKAIDKWAGKVYNTFIMVKCMYISVESR
jgi:hypothetical protein